MRRIALLVLLTCASVAFAQDSAPKTSFISDNLDKSVDPCVDFYQYSCGNWLAKHPIPADRATYGTGAMVFDQNLDTLHEALEVAANPSIKRSAPERRAGDYYAACMDERGIDAAGTKPLAAELARINAITTKAGLAAQIAHMHAMGMRDGTQIAQSGRAKPLFDFTAGLDDKNATKVIPIVDAGGIALPDRDMYVDQDERSKELREGYVKHVTNMFKLLGESPEKAAADANTVMAIETDLAKVSMTRTDRRDPNSIYHKMTVKELQALSPDFNWSAYFTAAAVPPTSGLNVREPNFVKGMNAAIAAHPLDHWKTYLKWQLVHSAVAAGPLLPARFVDENFDFYGRQLTGAKQLRPRWKRCIGSVDASLGEDLGILYIEKKFGPESKKRMDEMVANLEKALAADIESLDWMGAETKKAAMVKFHGITNKIGYPEHPRTYPTAVIRRTTPLANWWSVAADDLRWTLGRIRKPADKTEWQMTADTLNAYYDPQMNNINFPAGILQPPYFSKDNDDAINYGAIGGVIGHELTHGFDDQGAQYDANGNLRDWWTPEDEKKFKERASCIVDEYNTFTVKDPANADKPIHLNGKLTLGENAADNGGLRIAYNALEAANAGKEQPLIDGYTPEQRVFLGWGTVWCSNYRDQAAALQAKTNEHSVSMYRVLGVVQNMPEFQKAFSCKAGQPMVSAKACRIW
jgi:putative endopeptidase